MAEKEGENREGSHTQKRDQKSAPSFGSQLQSRTFIRGELTKKLMEALILKGFLRVNNS
jgi:hypothetical protein